MFLGHFLYTHPLFQVFWVLFMFFTKVDVWLDTKSACRRYLNHNLHNEHTLSLLILPPSWAQNVEIPYLPFFTAIFVDFFLQRVKTIGCMARSTENFDISTSKQLKSDGNGTKKQNWLQLVPNGTNCFSSTVDTHPPRTNRHGVCQLVPAPPVLHKIFPETASFTVLRI